MCNICELPINAVRVNRPKMLIGLDQNGKGYGWSVRMSLHAIYDTPGGQADTNPSVKEAEHGKPNRLHLSMESDPQGKLIDEWVKDVGKSESRSVIGRIRVQNLPGTKVCRLPTGVESRETNAAI